MDRTERQKLAIKKWLNNNGRGILECCTGFGKTYMTIMLICHLVEKIKGFSVIVVVPTSNLKSQWQEYVDKYNLSDNVKIMIQNTAAKTSCECDLLVVDEIHLALSNNFINIFKVIKHKYMLGLTATLERSDGRHEQLLEYYPILDTISIEEALQNNWLSDFREYLVLIDVDLSEYVEANKLFYKGFDFFARDFHLALKIATDYKQRNAYISKLCKITNEPYNKISKDVIIASSNFMKGLQKRKQFIYNHPKKVEIANKIIEYRKDKKIICFTHTIAIGEKINGLIYSGKDNKKEGQEKINNFINSDKGVLVSSRKLVTGFDCPDISVLIDMDINSSKVRATQVAGRGIRFLEGKRTEIFTLVLRGTKEEDWKIRSNTHNYITIDEENLYKILEGKEYEIKKNREVANICWY